MGFLIVFSLGFKRITESGAWISIFDKSGDRGKKVVIMGRINAFINISINILVDINESITSHVSAM